MLSLTRYKCKECGMYVSLLTCSPVEVCPLCDGVMERINPVSFLKVQVMLHNDGRESLIISGIGGVHSFCRKDFDYAWEPIELSSIYGLPAQGLHSVVKVF